MIWFSFILIKEGFLGRKKNKMLTPNWGSELGKPWLIFEGEQANAMGLVYIIVGFFLAIGAIYLFIRSL
jgi:hypothetical protein